MPDPEPQTKPKLARDPQALTSEYHKARKQLMLWAGILFIWALVGIDLEKARQMGGSAGTIIGALKSPQAIPWVLLILVGYFVFKTRTEWRQCNENRRQVREAKQDYYSACIVAGAACLLYLGQAISKVQVADLLDNEQIKFSLFSGIVFGMSVGSGAYRVIEYREVRDHERTHGSTVGWSLLRMRLAFRSMVGLTSFGIFIFLGKRWWAFLLGAAIAAVLMILLHILVSWSTKKILRD